MNTFLTKIMLTLITIVVGTNAVMAEKQTIFSFNVGSDPVGGKVEHNATNTDTNKGFKIDSDKKYIHITGISLQAGDLITLEGLASNADAVGFKLKKDAASTGISTQTVKKTTTVVTYTVTANDELNGSNTLHIYRSVNKSIYFQSIKIEREATPPTHYSYTVNAVDETNSVIKELTTGTFKIGDSAANICVPRYILNNGIFYETEQKQGAWYVRSIQPDKDAYVYNCTYKNTGKNNVVYYTEAEDNGAFTATSSRTATSIVAKSSNGDVAYNKGVYMKAYTLAPGKYKVVTAYINSNKDKKNISFKVGANVILSQAIAQDYSGELTSAEFSIAESTPLMISCEGSASSGLDYFYIIQTGEAPKPLVLTYSDGDEGDEGSIYYCNTFEETPQLPADITLSATDTEGNNVDISTLNVQYKSDDLAVATVSTDGKITLVGGQGTANIVATATSDNYITATAQYTITIQAGIDWHVKDHLTTQGPAPRDTFEIRKDGELYMVGTFGGWNRNGGTYNYPKTDGTTTTLTDSWGEVKQSKKGIIDGFSAYVSGAQDASDESMYSSLKKYYNSTVYGQERFGWFKPSTADEVNPFTLPVRGSYVTFEPKVNGFLTVYIMQNGPWNVEKKDIYDNEGNLVSQADGNAVPFPGIAPFQFRPHSFYIVNQDGYTVEENFVITSRTKVAAGINTEGKTQEAQTALNAFCEKYGCQPGEKFKCIIDENEDGYNDATNIGNWKEFKEYLSQEEQQRIHANWNSGANGAQQITRLDNGSYLALESGMVKYSFHVMAGETYYIFSNFSKLGLAGCNFLKVEGDGQPEGELNLSEDEKYNDASLKAPTTHCRFPMYATVNLDRKFTAGKWNTICLPFTMTEQDVDEAFGKGTELIMLDKVSIDNERTLIQMTCHEIHCLLAGYPYLIKTTKDVNGISVRNKAIIPGLSVRKFTDNGYASQGVDGFCDPQQGDVTIGNKTYNVTASAFLGEGDIYLTNNTLSVSRGYSVLKGYRSYFKKLEGTATAKTVSLAYTYAGDSESGATAIENVDIDDDAKIALGINKVYGGVYNLKGQKVADNTDGLPAGIYMYNGNKIIK